MNGLRSIGYLAGGVSGGLQAGAKLGTEKAFQNWLQETNQTMQDWYEKKLNESKSFSGKGISATPGNPATMPITQQAPAQTFAPSGGFGPTQAQQATLRAVAPTSSAMVTQGMQPPRKVAPFSYSPDPFGG